MLLFVLTVYTNKARDVFEKILGFSLSVSKNARSNLENMGIRDCAYSNNVPIGAYASIVNEGIDNLQGLSLGELDKMTQGVMRLINLKAIFRALLFDCIIILFMGMSNKEVCWQPISCP